MENASRSRVTITLGRSGQVVKRAGTAAENGSFSDSRPSVGSKRSVRDRLGSNFDSTTHFDNKRQRGDGGRMSRSADEDDMFLAKDDLRFKIIRKKMLQSGQSSSQKSNLDLRDILSRPAQSSTTSSGTQQRGPWKEDNRKQFLEPRDGRRQMQDPRNSKQQGSEPRNVRQQLSERGDYRLQPPEPRGGRYVAPEQKDARHYRLGSNNSSFPGQMLSSRSSDALPQMESLRSSHTPWTLDSFRQRPSDRFTSTSRGVSPRRRNEEQEQRPLGRAYDDPRVGSYPRKEVFEHRRPMSSSQPAKPALIAGPARTMGQLPALHSSVSLAQRNPYTVDDQPTVDSFLHSLGLDKYSINFKAEEVDMHALKQMGDGDLKDLGVPMGPRKKIMLALISQSKRQI